MIMISARAVTRAPVCTDLRVIGVGVHVVVSLHFGVMISLVKKRGWAPEVLVESLEPDFEDLGADLGKEVPDKDWDEDEEEVEKLSGNELGRVVLYVNLRREGVRW